MRFFICFFIAVLLCACSNSEGVSASLVEKSADSHKGLIRLMANGASVTLGTNDVKARSNDRPMMDVDFSYDFSVGRHEVTCEEFNKLMKAATGLSIKCRSGDLPVTNVTYYDAILFANERSKAENIDTAYTYSAKKFDSEKHCTNLEGFAFHPEVDAYRLPTEAEWVLAAKQNWNVKRGWTAENSNYKLHSVCEKAFEDEFCDMAGNAMEWVNDWFGALRDTTVMNYVGAPDGGTLGQRVVKGGSFHYTSDFVNLYSRGDVYAVTSSTKAEYVGFRLAFGAIPDALWMGGDGKANYSRVLPLAGSETIRSLFGTYKVKLAFRNDETGNIAYIDYSSGILSVVEISDTIDAYHPEISPDGKRVAFCTGLEGTMSQSALYVRDLNAEGSNLVKLNVDNAAIPRWRVLANGDTAIVYVTSANNNSDTESFKSSSTWQVKFSGGKFGTPQKLFDGAYHGGISEDNTLAVTGARLLRARIAEKGSTVMQSARDTVWYQYNSVPEQACNAALAKDSSKRTLFLDFGGETGRAFAGMSYGAHERLLIADSTGKLVKSIPAPSGYSFDHSEWTSNPNIAVATLANAEMAHPLIVLVNLEDSSIVQLADGNELWHPSLWVNAGNLSSVDFLPALDSIGVYYTIGGTDRAVILRYRMELMWKYKDSVELVALGSSRISNGLNPSELSVPAVNLSFFPNSLYDVYFFYRRYVRGNFKQLKYVVVSLDIDYWNRPKEDSFFASEYKNYPGYMYDLKHNYWKNQDYSFVYLATQNSLGSEDYKREFLTLKSTMFVRSQGWGELETYDSTWMDYQRSSYDYTYNVFVNFLKTTLNDSVTVVGVIFPQSPEYRKTGAWGKYGLRRSEAPDILDSLKRMQDKYSNFIFMDENKDGFHDYDDSMAQDCDHMSYKGAMQFSHRLDSLLKTLKK